VLRIWLKRAGEREGVINPPMGLALYVRSRLVPLNEQEVWYDQTFTHKTYGRFYTEWKDHQSLTFKDAIEQAYHNLATQVVNALFLTSPS
jgi:hypothetical protein